MQLTKKHVKILKFINKKSQVSYTLLENRFRKLSKFERLFDELENYKFVISSPPNTNEYGEPVDRATLTYFLTNSGIAEVESRQFLTLEYIIKNILVPIVVAVISTLITNFLFQIL